MLLRDLPKSRKMTIFAGVLLALLLGSLDQTIVGPAMPTIVKELFGMQLLTWVFTIYSLTSTVVIPIVGKLSDLYGRKWFYVGGIAIFLVGSALCGGAGSELFTTLFAPLGLSAMMQLIIARGIQGVGGGMMMSNGMAVVGDLFDPRERGKYQGFTGAVFGLSSVVGPALGGWLTDFASWRWIFWVNIPLGLFALGVLLYAMPRPEHGRQHSIDWWGSLALVTGLVPLLLALNSGGSTYAWLSVTILGLLAVSAVITALFIWRERRATEPIMDMGLFDDRSFSASMLVLFFSGVGMFGSIMFLPLFMQVVQGASAVTSGSLLMPMMIAMVTGSITCGQFIARTGRYKALGMAGLALATVGAFLLSRLQVDSTHLTVVVDMMLVGLGMGVTMPLFAIALQSQFPARIGEVTASVQFFRSIGGTVGVALLGGVMNAAFGRNLEGLIARHAEKFGTAGATLAKLAEEPSKLLNAGALQELASSMPVGSEKVMSAFLADIRFAMADAIAETFLIASGMMALALVAMFFVKEIPLVARPKLDTVEAIATELGVEESVVVPEA